MTVTASLYFFVKIPIYLPEWYFPFFTPAIMAAAESLTPSPAGPFIFPGQACALSKIRRFYKNNTERLNLLIRLFPAL